MWSLQPSFASTRSQPVCHAAVMAPTGNSIKARVNYVRPAPQGEELYSYVGDSKPDYLKSHTNLEHVPTGVEIFDLRTAGEEFTLDKNGFKMAKFRVPAGIDWTNNQQVQELYYPALQALLKEHTGASRVHIFDHTQRRGTIRDGSESDQKQNYDEQGNRPPVARAHVDYTTQSGINRLHALLPEEADKLQQTPFAVVQVWRPISGPVDDSPLAMVDASTVSPHDLLNYAIHFPGRTGYNYAVAENPQHRWYYAKGLQEDEAYLFVCYDSRQGRARFTPHTGFKDPSTPEAAPARWSVEARAYCFWEHEAPAAPAQNL